MLDANQNYAYRGTNKFQLATLSYATPRQLQCERTLMLLWVVARGVAKANIFQHSIKHGLWDIFLNPIRIKTDKNYFQLSKMETGQF